MNTASPIKKSTESLKILPYCCNFLLLINQIFDGLPEREEIKEFVTIILGGVERAPAIKHQVIRNMPLYVEFIEVKIHILSFLSILLRNNYTELVMGKIDCITVLLL